MKRMSRIALLAATFAGASACTSNHDSSDPPSLEPGTTESFAAVAEQCTMVTSIEVVHRVNGSPVTDRVRLTEDVGEDAALALRSFQVAANYFGVANVISSRPISQVQCFPQVSAAIKPIVKHFDPPLGLCADANGVVDCTLPQPSHTYDYSGTESCTFTNYTAATSAARTDSRASVTKNGDVVLTVNTANLRNEALARTQMLRALVGDANVITNFHFDIVVTPDQQASIVGNDAFASIAQQIKQASDNGQPLPDIQQILHNLPQPPTNVQFYTEMLRAYQTKLDRLQLLAKFTNGALLSPQQVNAFYQSFVAKSRLIDQLDVEHSTSSLNQAATLVNDAISQLATTSQSSTIYNQVKAGTDALLEAHTTCGVFDPDHKIDFVVPDLRQSLTDEDIQKRLVASEMMIDLNEAIERGDGKARVATMAGPLGLLVYAMDNDDTERVWRLYDQVKATEFFFDNTDPSGTDYDVHLTPDAQAMFNIQVQPNSAVAYEVINVMNETADYNATTGKVTYDLRAVITINARQALSANDVKRALYHTEEAYGVLDFLKTGGTAFLGGALKELGSTISGIYYTSIALWSDPEAYFDHLHSALANWRQTLDIVLDQGIDVIHRWPGMTLEQKSELLGRLATQIWLTLPPEAKQAGRVNEALQEAVRLHLDKAARGLQIIERGGVALSEELAVEVVKRLERYEILATEDAVKVLDELDNFLPCSLVGGGAPFAPTVLSSGPKPPCTIVGEVAQGFESFEARAQRIGVVAKADLSDLLRSTEKLVPAPDRLIKRAMDTKEITFAEQILAKEDGVMFGNAVNNRKGIDGFFAGSPMQLKTQTAENMKTVKDAVRWTQKQAGEEGFKEVRVFQKLENLTKAEALAYILDPTKPLLGIPKVGGTIRSIDILTSDGFWLHIEGGVVR